MNSETIERSVVDEYFITHHFMPAYTQTFSGTASFIAVQSRIHKESKKKLDFFLPKNSIKDKQLIKKMLFVQLKINPEKIKFIDKNSALKQDNHSYIRIFTFKGQRDEVFHKIIGKPFEIFVEENKRETL